ncbi:polyprenyl synthetase family protein [Aquibacillus albus]|uniref:Competence protein ComQ n=1 Tax=Aquibacillus albus TaxID=1168171 RepID=A0ABS2N4C8_9BACI|nr:polyprenyl synthetase family protein [Aquibacillus albus]MBM7572982.1 competence protein ComQ [Aquibacillus albus]
MVLIPKYSPDEITEVMLRVVNIHLDDNDLKENAIPFILYKREEGFSFSELTQIHYHMDNDEKSPGMLPVSAAVEFLILALDILDDLQDQDDMEKPWSKTPFSTSMNISTGFLMLSVLILEQAPYEEKLKSTALQHLHGQVLQAVKGQHQDLKRSNTIEEDFLRMIEDKSGSLMACSTLIGATLNHSTQQETIRDYSRSFGVTAQLANDINGLLRLDTKNDLLQKQWTLPIMLLSKEKDEKAQWIRDYYNNKVNQKFLVEREESLFQWIHQSPVISYVRIIKRLYQRKAIDRMRDLHVSQEWKSCMEEYLEHL